MHREKRGSTPRWSTNLYKLRGICGPALAGEVAKISQVELESLGPEAQRTKIRPPVRDNEASAHAYKVHVSHLWDVAQRKSARPSREALGVIPSRPRFYGVQEAMVPTCLENKPSSLSGGTEFDSLVLLQFKAVFV